ncbi:MAG: hypothetical protein ACI901_000586, partial [Octadecabacter sp.]
LKDHHNLAQLQGLADRIKLWRALEILALKSRPLHREGLVI